MHGARFSSMAILALPTACTRCHSQYNGCKWRGHVLRVEAAKPDFQKRIRLEHEEEEQLEAEALAAAAAAAAEQESAKPMASGKLNIAPRTKRGKVGAHLCYSGVLAAARRRSGGAPHRAPPPAASCGPSRAQFASRVLPPTKLQRHA